MKVNLLWVIICLLIAILTAVITIGIYELSRPHKILEHHHHDSTIYGNYSVDDANEYGKKDKQ